MSSSSSRMLSRFLLSSSLKFSPSPNKFKAFSYSSSTSNPTDYIKRLEKTDREVKIDLQTEIKRVEKFDNSKNSPSVSPDYVCPFEVIDIPGDDKLIFKRDFGSEKIVIEAKLEDKRMNIVITILKEDGSLLTYTDTTFVIGYGGYITCKTSDGSFEEWDGLCNLSYYLHKRGIDDSFSDYAYNYLIGRYKAEYVRCLKRVTQILDS